MTTSSGIFLATTLDFAPDLQPWQIDIIRAFETNRYQLILWNGRRGKTRIAQELMRRTEIRGIEATTVIIEEHPLDPTS